jgi:hypothetical protein
LPVVDLLKSAAIADQHTADVDSVLAPSDSAVVADVADLEAIRVLRWEQLARHLPRGADVYVARREAIVRIVWPLFVELSSLGKR